MTCALRCHRQRKKNKEGQERAKSVDLHAEDLVDEAEQRLKRELSQFSSSARSAGFIVNTVEMHPSNSSVCECVPETLSLAAARTKDL